MESKQIVSSCCGTFKVASLLFYDHIHVLAKNEYFSNLCMLKEKYQGFTSIRASFQGTH